MVIGHGLAPYRQSKNLLWDVIIAACGKPTPTTSTPNRLAAFRVVSDLKTNPDMMNDDSVRVRSFVCAALNHQFLDEWLLDLYNNIALVQQRCVLSFFLIGSSAPWMHARLVSVLA